MRQVVNHVGKGKFRLFWQGRRNSIMDLNFNPIVDQFGLKGDFVLLHWQAMPKYLRRWGMYCSTDDKYYPFDFDKFKLSACCHFQTLQLNERKWNTKPTAVIWVKDVKLSLDVNEGEYILE